MSATTMVTEQWVFAAMKLAEAVSTFEKSRLDRYATELGLISATTDGRTKEYKERKRAEIDAMMKAESDMFRALKAFETQP